jgi:hypothetical protein
VDFLGDEEKLLVSERDDALEMPSVSKDRLGVLAKCVLHVLV